MNQTAALPTPPASAPMVIDLTPELSRAVGVGLNELLAPWRAKICENLWSDYLTTLHYTKRC